MSLYWEHDRDTIRKINQLNYPVIAVCGSSGSGKTTLTEYLVKLFSSLEIIKTYTTRTKRETDDANQFEYLSNLLFLEYISNQRFFLYRLGGLPYYGYGNQDIMRVIADRKVPIFMFRNSGLKAAHDLIRNVYTVYIYTDPLKALEHSKDMVSDLSINDIVETTTLIENVISDCEKTHIMIRNDYTRSCFLDNRLMDFVMRAISDVR